MSETMFLSQIAMQPSINVISSSCCLGRVQEVLRKGTGQAVAWSSTMTLMVHGGKFLHSA